MPENSIIKTEKKEKEIKQDRVNYLIQIAPEINDALMRYQNSAGLNKRAAVEKLIGDSLVELGYLQKDYPTITPPTFLTGRPSYQTGNVKISGTVSVPIHNAIITARDNDANMRGDTKAVIIQKLLIIGLRNNNIKIEQKASE